MIKGREMKYLGLLLAAIMVVVGVHAADTIEISSLEKEVPDAVSSLMQMTIDQTSNGTMEVLVEWVSSLESASLDLFRAMDLAVANWQLVTNFPTAGTTDFWWNEQETNSCFFVVGTDYDEDLDGLSSARERFLYKTREDLPDTDLDGLSDFFEIQNGLDPLYGDSNTNGIGDLAEFNLANSIAANGSGGVLVVQQTGWYHATDPRLNWVYLGE